MPKVKRCKVCRKMFKVFSYRPRQTCSKDCQSQLAAIVGKAWQKDMKKKANEAKKQVRHEKRDPTPEQTAEVLKCSLKLRPAMQPAVANPRRKCPTCLQRVRLFNSVAGAVWLVAHRGIDGGICEGSRHIVSYPLEKADFDE